MARNDQQGQGGQQLRFGQPLTVIGGLGQRAGQVGSRVAALLGDQRSQQVVSSSAPACF